jgi:hypothetical protein
MAKFPRKISFLLGRPHPSWTILERKAKMLYGIQFYVDRAVGKSGISMRVFNFKMEGSSLEDITERMSDKVRAILWCEGYTFDLFVHSDIEKRMVMSVTVFRLDEDNPYKKEKVAFFGEWDQIVTKYNHSFL